MKGNTQNTGWGAKWCNGGMGALSLAAMLCLVFLGEVRAETLNATVNMGSCAVIADPTSIAMGDLDPSPLVDQHWAVLHPTPLTIKLSNCSGLGASDGTPVVTVSGNTTTDPVMSTYKKYFFINGNSTAVGFGFTLQKAVNGAGNNNNLLVIDGEHLYIPKSTTAPTGPWYGKGETLTGDHVVPLKVEVSCGEKSWCSPSRLKAGDINADVTFTFAYR